MTRGKTTFNRKKRNARQYGMAHTYLLLTQFYISLDPSNESNFSSSLASYHYMKPLITPAWHIGKSYITSSGSAKDLGDIFDKYLSKSEQVKFVCRAAY